MNTKSKKIVANDIKRPLFHSSRKRLTARRINNNRTQLVNEMKITNDIVNRRAREEWPGFRIDRNFHEDIVEERVKGTRTTNKETVFSRVQHNVIKKNCYKEHHPFSLSS